MEHNWSPLEFQLPDGKEALQWEHGNMGSMEKPWSSHEFHAFPMLPTPGMGFCQPFTLFSDRIKCSPVAEIKSSVLLFKLYSVKN